MLKQFHHGKFFLPQLKSIVKVNTLAKPNPMSVSTALLEDHSEKIILVQEMLVSMPCTGKQE